jgi:hypothetical protein
VLFTNHKVLKFTEFTNTWNSFVCLFFKSELVTGLGLGPVLEQVVEGNDGGMTLTEQI